VRDSQRDRRVARALGLRRVQTVTTWTAAASVVAAAVLSAVLGQATSPAARTANLDGTTSVDGGSGDRLRAPDYLPGASGDGTPHGSTGGS
jgi:hypothetical protein